MRNNAKRGQLSIMGIMMVFVTLVVYMAFRPALIEIISTMGLTGADKLIADLIPFIMLIGILASLVLYIWPQRTQSY